MTLNRLAEDLEEDVVGLIALLTKHGEQGWATWLGEALAPLRAGDPAGVDRLLLAYGGMGSLNDLVLHPVNGHTIDESEIDHANEELGAFTSRMWRRARTMRLARRGWLGKLLALAALRLRALLHQR